METKILLTSFSTWLPHHKSNSSNDLLLEVENYNFSTLSNLSLFFLRNLPVDIQQASEKAITEIERIEPDVVICCGMAEKRTSLAIELRAWCGKECLSTGVNLSELKQSLVNTEFSNDAGKFVCEGLYYQMLKYFQLHNKDTNCIFVHVPKLQNDNLNLILEDFRHLLTWFEVTKAKKSAQR